MKKSNKGNMWFPGEERERVAAANEKLEVGDVYHDEVERYINHFEPLLMAEHAENERIFYERLEDWPVQRLVKAGLAMEDMVASPSRWQPKIGGGHVYEFRKTGKEAIRPLGYHRFMNGTRVILSRTDPLVDPLMKEGLPANPEDVWEFQDLLESRVYSVGRGFLRIQTNKPIQDFEMGKWRIDEGMSDWGLRKQIESIRSLHLDPSRQDIADMRYYEEVIARPARAPRPTRNSTVRAAEDDAMMAALEAEREIDHAKTIEQTILQGTTIRDRLLRAFQEDFVPYESSAGLSTKATVPNSELVAPSTGLQFVSDGIVKTQHDLKAWDVDAIPTLTQEGQGIEDANTNNATGVLARNLMIQNWAARYRANDGAVVKVDGDPEVGLNSSQMRAIAMMLSERLSLVQGPPGTGKTRVIIETIKLLKKHWQIPHPILVTAHTNVAVDNLVSGLRKHGLKAVRTGNTDRVRPDLQEYVFDERLRSHPLFEDVEALEEEKEALWKIDKERLSSGQSALPISVLNARRKEVTSKLFKKRSIMFGEVLKDADVICTTCLSAGSQFVHKHIDFPIVFLDEASMATEPLSLIPLMRGSSHVAIIGDHKQLPPVIISEAARAGGLATSLFERLIHEKHVPSIMLDTQYRMHPAISAFPSQTFYNSDLKDGTVDQEGQVVDGFDTPVTSYLMDEERELQSMIFVDHQHAESPEMKSIANYGDAQIVVDIVVDLLNCNPDLKGSDIGIITPYAAQIRVIERQLYSDPTRNGAIQEVLGDRSAELDDVEIKTVDGFEGREKEVILFSTVRSNPLGYIGFLADWRRLNVGITRAKRGLVIIGSANTLERARIGGVAEDSLPQGGVQVWKDFMRFLRDRGLIIRR